MLSPTMLALIGASALSAAAALAGAILLLRRQALASGAFAHAAFPGAASATVLAFWAGGTGSAAPGIGTGIVMAGAMLAALLAAWSIALLGAQRRIGPETAVAVVMVGFFGVGALAFSYLETIAPAAASTLRALLTGSAAAMPPADVALAVGLLAALATATRLTIRPLSVLLFDRALALAEMRGLRLLEIATIGALSVTVAAGARAIGVVITVGAALLPALTAKLFARHTGDYLWLSAVLGAVIGAAGAGASAAFDAVPAGPAIVVAGGLVLTIVLAAMRVRIIR